MTHEIIRKDDDAEALKNKLGARRKKQMGKIVLTWGLISGGIVSVFVAAFPLFVNGQLDLSDSEIVGYTIMFLGFLMVFFGIRSYRDTVGGGVITFRRGFKVGILITLVSCAMYV